MRRVYGSSLSTSLDCLSAKNCPKGEIPKRGNASWAGLSPISDCAEMGCLRGMSGLGGELDVELIGRLKVQFLIN